MEAIYIENWGGPEQLVLKELEMPTARPGEILIRVKAFGLNHAEGYFREGIWPGSRVTGIECVGEVEDDSTGSMKKGQTVATIMGGLGRDRQGSYAQYVSASAANVFKLNRRTLSWAELAAVPEAYATAWWCLLDNLKLKKGQTVLIRGGTSSVGQAAINVASEMGCTILSTSRSDRNAGLLKDLGAREFFQDQGEIAAAVRQRYPDGIDAVLELVGNATLRDSLKIAKKGGRVCNAGFVGGLTPVEGFNPIMDLPSGVDLSFFGSFMLGQKGFPPDVIPMQDFVDKAARGAYKAKPVKVFRFSEIVDAHRLMDSGNAKGKIVVTVGDEN